MPFFETADHTRLFYRDWGTGQPVVFIHGWAVGGGMWEYQMTPLAEQGLRCIACDMRGCGRSDDPGRGYDYDTLADDLAALLDHLDIQGVTLVGHSMGGGVIARYLSRRGAGRIARTVLAATTTPFLLKTDDNPEGLDQSILDDIIARMTQDRPRYIADIAPSFFGVGLPECSVSPEMIQWGINLAMQATPQASVALARTNSLSDQRAELPVFTIPTLVIHGDSDGGCPIGLTGGKMAQAIPGCRLLIYKGGPHGLFITHRDRFNADLLAFIQG